MFECRICGKKWNDKHFAREGTFYTLCDPCADRVLEELRSGQTAREIQVLREAKNKK